MEEDGKNGDGAKPAHKQEVNPEPPAADGSPIGKLVKEKLLRQIPSHKKTGQESAYGQENLSGHEVEQVEE